MHFQIMRAKSVKKTTYISFLSPDYAHLKATPVAYFRAFHWQEIRRHFISSRLYPSQHTHNGPKNSRSGVKGFVGCRGEGMRRNSPQVFKSSRVNRKKRLIQERCAFDCDFGFLIESLLNKCGKLALT